MTRSNQYYSSKFNNFVSWMEKSFQVILCSFAISSLLCCSPASLPKQIYLKKSSMSESNMVSLIVSSKKLSVSYSKESLNPAIMVAAIIPIVALYNLLFESTIDSSQDEKRSENLKTLQKPFEKVLGNYFIDKIKKANIFKINYSELKPYQKLKMEGYNATIKLDIEKLELRKQPFSKHLKVYLSVEGKMIDLHQEKVVWKRNETLLSEQEYTLDELKENLDMLGQLIDQMLKKVAFGLANDIIYS